MALNSQNYSENGVAISKEKIFVGDKVTLTYDGILAKSGADVIIAHIGYGELWDEKLFITMDLVDGIFKASFKITQSKDLNISFKDSAENWDNNSTSNYTFSVAEKAKANIKEEASKQVKKVAGKAEVKKVVENAKKTIDTKKTIKSEAKPEKAKKEVKKKP